MVAVLTPRRCARVLKVTADIRFLLQKPAGRTDGSKSLFGGVFFFI
jgi:hypothetical protein